MAEVMFKVVKTEFTKVAPFNSVAQLRFKLSGYVHWLKHFRIHGTLGYQTPVEYLLQTL